MLYAYSITRSDGKEKVMKAWKITVDTVKLFCIAIIYRKAMMDEVEGA